MTGASGVVEFPTSGNWVDYTFRVYWEQTFTAGGTSSTITITKCTIQASKTVLGTWWMDGYITINGVDAIYCWYTGNSSHPSFGINTTDEIELPSMTGSVTVDQPNGAAVDVNITVKHNKQSSWGFYFWNSSYGNYSFTVNDVTKSIALAAIQQNGGTIESVGSTTLGEVCSVTWTPLSAAFRYKIRFAMGSWNATTDVIYPNKTTSYTYNSYIIPLEAARQIPNATTGTMTATLMTYSDANCTEQVGSDSPAANFEVTVPTTVIPTITGVSATIVNDNSTVNSWGVALATMSKVKLNGTASGSYGSTIARYTITGGYSTTTATWPYTGVAVNKSGNVTFTVQVTDSRGRKSVAVTTPAVTFIAYSKPSISAFTVARDSASATIANASASFSYTSIKVDNVEKNSVIATLYYKKSSDTVWSSTSLSNNTMKAISVSDTSSYDFKLMVTDALNNSTTLERYISTMAAVMSFGADGSGLGIGKVAESSNLEIGFKTIFFDDVYIRIGSSNVLLKDYIKGVMNGTYT